MDLVNGNCRSFVGVKMYRMIHLMISYFPKRKYCFRTKQLQFWFLKNFLESFWTTDPIFCLLILLFWLKQIQSEKKSASLKEQLGLIMPLVDDLRAKKDERVKQFGDIKAQIEKITGEISGCCNIVNSLSSLNLEEHDLSMRKLSECQSHLLALQKEKVCMD